LSDLLRRLSYPLTYLTLVVFCVMGMTTHRGPVELGLAQRLLLSITLPLERVVTFPVRETRRLWRDYVGLVDVREHNEELRQRVTDLELENLQYKEAIVSSERFQRLAGFRAKRGISMVPANVVAQDLSPWFQAVIIDQGSSAGIGAGMPVITDSGVVGVVAGTTPGASKVLLVIDPQSRVDVYVQRTRARGTLRGRTDLDCEFLNVLREDDVREGDLVLTSGLAAMYPKGLVVGRVSRVERKPFGLFQRAEVEPAVDFSKLEEVFVILERRELPADDAFFSESAELWPEARE
jgi:rod shape-determining protein MreC